MRIKRIPTLIAILCLSMSVLAEPYEKQPNRGLPDKALPETFTNSVTFLQSCTFGGIINCQTSASLGVRYTSGSAYSELASLYGCTYKTSTYTRVNSPGYDLYYCGSTSRLPGYTIFVLVEGDYSTSFAGTISALYQP